MRRGAAVRECRPGLGSGVVLLTVLLAGAALLMVLALGAQPVAATAGRGAPAAGAAAPGGGAGAPAAEAGVAARPGDEFFIVSSVDAARGRIVLKRPTEVTLVMHVTARTAYRDERGRPLRLADLRAGDTAYIRYGRDPAGEATAVLVRLGPMTVPELHRRYPPDGPS
jgi:hypothetical protein